MSQNQAGLLILKTTAQSMKAAELFLKNRDWRFASTSSLKEAITFIIKHRPQYLLLAADHPNKKVKILPKLLGQAFPMTVIAYSENSTNQNVLALQAMEMEFKLFPPISGPAIVRMLAKVEKELIQRSKNASQEAKDFQQFNQGSATPVGGGQDIAPNILQQLLHNASSESEEETSMPIFESGTYNESENSGIYIPTAPKKSEGFFYNPQDSGTQGIGGSVYQPTGKKKNFLITPEKRDEDPYASNWQHDSAAAPAQTKSQAPDSTSKKPPGNIVGIDHEEEVSTVEILNSIYDSLMLEGAIQSLNEVLDHENKMATPQKVQDVSQVMCLVVESAKFSGYLILAMGKNVLLNEDLMAQIKAQLFQFLRKNGEAVDNQDSGPLQLKIQQVEFNDWALTQAEFLIRSVHHDQEVVMAFFPEQNIKLQTQKSFAEHMLQVQIDDIEANAELEFDLYIYLPANQKYVLYNKEGRKMHGEQVSRLKTKGVTHMHLEKKSSEKAAAYKAQNQLNKKIQLFHSGKRKKTG